MTNRKAVDTAPPLSLELYVCRQGHRGARKFYTDCPSAEAIAAD
jgi:hypothetical protein